MSRCSGQYVYIGFSRRKILRSSADTIAEKAIQFWHPDWIAGSGLRFSLVVTGLLDFHTKQGRDIRNGLKS